MEACMSIYEFGPFRLESERLLLFLDGTPVALGPKVVETLLALVEHPGEVLSKSVLLDRIWPEGWVEEANLAQNIYVLRKTLATHWSTEVIETVPRHGYRFAAPVTLAESSSRPTFAVRGQSWWQRMAAAGAAVIMVAAVMMGTMAIWRDRHASAQAASLSPAGTRLYAIGRYYWNQRTRSAVERSLAYFAQVIQTDPHDGRGYAALADANAIMADYGYGSLPKKAYLRRAHDYAGRALALDPASAPAYAVLGLVEFQQGSPERAMRDLSRALALDPSYGPAREWHGDLLLTQGKPREALRELKAAATLDPLSVSTTAWLSLAAYVNRRYPEALGYARQTIDLSPQRPDAWAILGMSYEARGEYPQAIDAYKRFATKCGMCRGESAALLAHAYANEHDYGAARASLAVARANVKSVDAGDLAFAYAAIGQREAAISWLKRVGNRTMRIWVAQDPRFDALRSDQRLRNFPTSPA
jgi:DNA-binding winged helix-turn-helix (wHTH) protein/tetratricopeptide (TPR) repeat protein